MDSKRTQRVVDVCKLRLLVMILPAVTGIARGQTDAQSTTGPIPPLDVLMEMMEEELEGAAAAAPTTTLEDFVPCYLWRHGCGPTALGMVIGYYDRLGWEELVPGDAATQTAAVNQMIASGGSVGSPWPTGSEQHFEDYALPLDSSGLLADDYITARRSAHFNNCLADFMLTSRSSEGNKYGWSWVLDVGPAFIDYVNLVNPAYNPSAQYYSMGNSLTWQVLTSQIDAGQPMVFLVDSDGNGGTDHFVAVIGYNDGPPHQYCFYDTWSSTLRTKDFVAKAPGQPWGVGYAYGFNLNSQPPDVVETPDVAGLIRAEAEKQLVQAGLNATIDAPYGDTPSLDVVVSQEPGAGEMALPGSTVVLTVATCDFNGDNRVNLPDFALLASDWLTCNATVWPLTNLNLDAGGCVDGGDLVPFALFFAQSAAATLTPSVTGQTQTQAQATLNGVGLSANVILLNNPADAGVVFKQAPSAASETPAGGQVDIYVSLGPEN